MNKTIIINYWSLQYIGGIEKYIYELSNYMVDHGVRIIWLCNEKPRVAKSFSSLMLSDKIERVHVKGTGLHWFSYEPFEIKNNEETLVLSFNPLNMGIAESLYRDFGRPSNMHLFYVVANTTGNTYFVERNFRIARKFVYNVTRKILKRWEEANQIRFFAPLHIKYLENNYDIKISSVEDKLVKEVYGFPPLNETLLQERCKRMVFNIVTVGRFDFPHKAYMLGLVRAYGRLKPKYSNLKLTIIGYGQDRNKLIDEINKLPLDYRADISLVGEVAPDDLPKYFEEANLNISVASGVTQGARVGVISIPARNFCEGECEVYGYLPESRDMTTSLDEGMLVDPFIEEVINMPDDVYLKRSIDSYYAIKNRADNIADPMYFFKTLSLWHNLNYSNKEISFLKYLNLFIRIINRLKFLK